MNTADMKRVETHLKRTFNTGGIILKPRGKPNDSAEVYVGDEFIGVVFEDEDGERLVPGLVLGLRRLRVVVGGVWGWNAGLEVKLRGQV